MIICFRNSKSSEKKNRKPPLATTKKSPEPPPEPAKPTNPVITHKTTPKTGPRQLFDQTCSETPASGEINPLPCGTPTSSVSPGSVASVASTGKVSKRGRPRKDVQPPSFDDFPVTGTAEEQKHWLKVKNIAYWRYAKLSGPHGEDYRKKESARVQKYQKKKDQDLQESSNGNEEEPILVDDTDVTESRTEKIKEQNQIRFVKLIIQKFINLLLEGFEYYFFFVLLLNLY